MFTSVKKLLCQAQETMDKVEHALLTHVDDIPYLMRSHVRYFRDLAALQLEMGHSTPRLLHSRYVSPIPHSAAQRFWKDVKV